MAKASRKERRAQQRAAAKTSTPSAPPRAKAVASPRQWPYLLPALLLALIVFGQTMGFDFVNWDDDLNVLENRGVLTFDLQAIWTETVIGNYNPLPITTFAMEHALVGLDAGLYHATNLVLHLICVALVFYLGRRLRLEPLPAALLACLFAIHPLRVESVAWITERKDVLFAAFYFGALFLYERRRDAGHKSSWSWSIGGLFALALLSKIQAVSLPLSMLCFDYLRQRELRWQEVLAKAPYFAMSLAVGLAGIYFLGRDGSLTDATDYTFIDRLAVGAYAYTVYLIKSVLPYEMSPLYPYPSELPARAYAAFGVVLAAAAAVLVGYKKQWLGLVFGLALFTVNVVFMLQVLGAGQGYLADRFTYVGYFGLFWLFAYGLQHLLTGKPKLRTAILAAAGVYVLVLTVMAFRQTKIWANGGTLWAHVTELYPQASTAHGNRAQYLREQGEFEEALVLFGKAIEANPKSGAYLNSRGKLHFDQGRTQEAIADYTTGIEREPDLAELYINRGAAFAKTGQYPKAEEDLNYGLEIADDKFNGLLNRSLLYYTQQRYEEALRDYDELLRLRPERDDLWQERGSIRSAVGRHQEGIADVEEAIRRAKDPQQLAVYREVLANLQGK